MGLGSVLLVMLYFFRKIISHFSAKIFRNKFHENRRHNHVLCAVTCLNTLLKATVLAYMSNFAYSQPHYLVHIKESTLFFVPLYSVARIDDGLSTRNTYVRLTEFHNLLFALKLNHLRHIQLLSINLMYMLPDYLCLMKYIVVNTIE